MSLGWIEMVADLSLAGALLLVGIGGMRPAYSWESVFPPRAKDTANVAGDNPEAKERVVHFPADRSLGRLWVQDAGAVRKSEPFSQWIGGTKWEYVCPAQGDITVPAGKRLRLIITPEGWRDLSPLSRLQPDDLYDLSFLITQPGEPKPDDQCMPHLAHLTGLRSLGLWETRITDRGMAYLRNMESLESLILPNITDAGLAHVAELRSLKRLYFKSNGITNSGLASLAKLHSLEEIELGGGSVRNAGRAYPSRMTDAGLVHLANLPSLKYLLLWGKGFTEAGLVHLRRVPSLKTLVVDEMRITDKGLEHLSELPALEALHLDASQVTSRGLARLKSFRSLKTFYSGEIRFTDDTLAYLKDLKSLEHLDISAEYLTDAGLAQLTGLSNLRHLTLSMAYLIDVKGYKTFYTDKGLDDLTKLQRLEYLSIAGPGVTDAGMAHVAKLSNLKDLSLFGCRNVTVQGIAKLTALKSLKKIWIYAANIKVSDLASLNQIPTLTHVRVNQIERDDSALNLSGLTQLEDLTVTLAKRREFRDDDLACLAALTRLRWLQGFYGTISDAGLKNLAALTNMERLGVGGSRVTDAGLAHLAGMKKLDNLAIEGDFTDTGLRHLEQLKALTVLIITSRGAFSNAALDRLRAQLPSLRSLRVVP